MGKFGNCFDTSGLQASQRLERGTGSWLEDRGRGREYLVPPVWPHIETKYNSRYGGGETITGSTTNIRSTPPPIFFQSVGPNKSFSPFTFYTSFFYNMFFFSHALRKEILLNYTYVEWLLGSCSFLCGLQGLIYPAIILSFHPVHPNRYTLHLYQEERGVICLPTYFVHKEKIVQLEMTKTSPLWIISLDILRNVLIELCLLDHHYTASSTRLTGLDWLGMDL